MKKYTILSKKSNQMTFLVGKKRVIKIVNKDLFQRLLFLKKQLKNINILHFENYLQHSENKIILEYKFYNNNYSQIQNYWKNPQKYIDYIFPAIQNLNIKTLKWVKNTFFSYLHNDPQFMNHIIKNDSVYFIDLESLVFQPVIFQPFYLFLTILLDYEDYYESYSLQDVMKLILEKFLKEKIYKISFEKIGSKKSLDLFLKTIEDKNYESYNITRKFMKENFSYIVGIIEKNL